MRYGLVFAIGVVLVGSDDTRAMAQPRAGGTAPAYSPYLNLLRQGNSPALNYYGLVRPQVQAREAIGSLQSQVGTNSQSISDLANGGPRPSTDKTVGFMNYGGYFQNFSPAASAQGGTGAGGSGPGGSGVGFGTIGGGRGAAGGAGGRAPAAPRR